MYAGSSRMSGTSAEEEVEWGGGVQGWRGGDAVLTHVELTDWLSCSDSEDRAGLS